MNKNAKITLVILGAGTVLSLAARVYIIVAHTDMTTGFLYHGEALMYNLIYYGIIAAAAIASIFTARTDGQNVGERTVSNIGGAGAVIVGIFTMFAGLFAAYEGLIELKAITPTMFLTVVDFLFGAIMIVIAFVTLYKREFTPGVGYSYSLIGAYCICRGIYCFMNRMVMISVPEYLIECLSLIGMSVFFVMLGRFLSGNETRNTRRFTCFWGGCSALLTLSSAFGTLIAKLAAPEEIRARIAMTSNEAELFRQSSEGIDAYKLTATPWVNVCMALITVTGIAVMLANPKETDNH